MRRQRLHYRRNADPHRRDLERRAAAGDTRAVMAWGNAMLRAGQLTNPADRNAVAAANLLGEHDSSWRLVHSPAGFALQRELPFGYTITVSNDPVRLGYEGGAVGWGNTPLVHFRTEGGGGVLHPAIVGGNMSSPRALAQAAEYLEKPGARLLGAVTLAADEGRVPRISWPGWEMLFEIEEAADPATADLRGSLLRAAGLWRLPFKVRDPIVSARAINDAQAKAIDYVDEGLEGAYDRSIYPVNAFRAFEWIPFAEILHEFGFHDESWGNDESGRAAREVGGPDRGASQAQPWLDWRGEWPTFESPHEENYELSVWSYGLHPDDKDAWGQTRYGVELGTTDRTSDAVEVGFADTEQALRMILINLGLKPVRA